MKKTRQSKGFTLVEMLIVIAVIAILYTLAAANVMSMQIEAKIAITKGDLKTLKFALDSYIEKNYVCPRKSDYQRILIHEEPTIIFSNLLDPFAKTSNIMYPYEISNNKKNYVVYSIGPNRNGKATIGNDGRVLIKGSPIFETNGYD